MSFWGIKRKEIDYIHCEYKKWRKDRHSKVMNRHARKFRRLRLNGAKDMLLWIPVMGTPLVPYISVSLVGWKFAFLLSLVVWIIISLLIIILYFLIKGDLID